MTLPLSPNMVRKAYEFLCETPPIKQWNLPSSDDIRFAIANDPNTIAWHTAKGRGKKRRHVFAISAKCVGHTTTLLMAVAHEMVHLHHDLVGIPVAHGEAFKKHARQICKANGWDAKAF